MGGEYGVPNRVHKLHNADGEQHEARLISNTF